MAGKPTKTVEEIGKLSITGNIVPPAWFQHITYETGSGKRRPHHLAIHILSDWVYWYRPKEIRDEGSGLVIGYEKRFASHRLQKSYGQIADQFGCTKREAKAAVDLLVDLGLSVRTFETINAGGQALSNVMFVELVPRRIAELMVPLLRKNVTPSHKKMVPPPTENSETYTEITTETATEKPHVAGVRITEALSYYQIKTGQMLGNVLGLISNIRQETGLTDDDIARGIEGYTNAKFSDGKRKNLGAMLANPNRWRAWLTKEVAEEGGGGDLEAEWKAAQGE